MGQYKGIAPSLFEEPEIRNSVELLVSAYIMAHSDMLGVCPVGLRVMAAKLKIRSARSVTDALNYFESIGKLIFSEDRLHVWWKSGAWHSLYCGKGSESQKAHVGELIAKWNHNGSFGKEFAATVTQHYATKYNYRIPYPHPPTLNLNTEAVSVAVSEPPAATPVLDGNAIRASFEKHIVENGESIQELWRINWGHVGGAIHLGRVADAVRAKLLVEPDRYLRVALEKKWGSLLMSFMQADVRSGIARAEYEKHKANGADRPHEGPPAESQSLPSAVVQ